MSFLGVTAHWGYGDTLKQVTLDFIKYVFLLLRLGPRGTDWVCVLG